MKLTLKGKQKEIVYYIKQIYGIFAQKDFLNRNTK